MSGLAFSVFPMLSNGIFFCELRCHKIEYVYHHMTKLRIVPPDPLISLSLKLSPAFSGLLGALDKWTYKYCTCSSSSSWHSSLFQSSFLLMSFSPSTLVACPRGYHNAPAAGLLVGPPPPPPVSKMF